MPIPSSWQQQTAKLDRAAKAKTRKATRTGPSEREISKAIAQAFKLKHHITLHETDAGGMTDKKGVIRLPKDLAAFLGWPQVLPFGLEPWVALPPGWSDRTGVANQSQLVFIEVKVPGGSFRPGQKEFLAARRAEGHVAFWASSVDDALAQFAEQMRRTA